MTWPTWCNLCEFTPPHSKAYHTLPWQPPGNTPEEMYGMWRRSEVYWYEEKKKNTREKDSWFQKVFLYQIHIAYTMQCLKERSWCACIIVWRNSIQWFTWSSVLTASFLPVVKVKMQGLINLINEQQLLPKTPAYDLRLTYRFQHGFHHSVVQPHAKGKPLEKQAQAWQKAWNQCGKPENNPKTFQQ